MLFGLFSRSGLFEPLLRAPYSVSSVVSLAIYNAAGQRIATPVDEEKQPGSYEVDIHNSRLSSGAHCCRLAIGGNVRSSAMILMRQQQQRANPLEDSAELPLVRSKPSFQRGMIWSEF